MLKNNRYHANKSFTKNNEDNVIVTMNHIAYKSVCKHKSNLLESSH